MKKISINKFGVHSVAKVVGVLYALIGLVPGAFLALLSFIPMNVEGAQSASLIFGAGALITLPILYGVIGYLFGALFAWLFNQITPRVGGINVEVEEVVNTEASE